MIRAVIMMNNQGMPRLVKFYDYQVRLRRGSRKLFKECSEVLGKLNDPIVLKSSSFRLIRAYAITNAYFVHTILDEMILGGQVLETSSSDVFEAVEEISRLEKTSNSVPPKSIFNWLVDSL